MSYDLIDKGYEEFFNIKYYSRDSEGNVREIEYSIQEPGFDKVLHEFLSLCVGVFEWDRATMKAKAYEAIAEWEE